jgi:hypothetical protein
VLSACVYTMATEVCRSPVLVSPRKPLANLIANVHGTPTKRLTNIKSPFKPSPYSTKQIVSPLPVISLLPEVVLPQQLHQQQQDQTHVSRKRVYEEMQSSSQDDGMSLPRTQHTVGTSFSSLIDYNAKQSSPAPVTLQVDSDNTSVKAVSYHSII